MKICTTCDKNKQLSEYYYRKDTKNYFGECKECSIARNNKWKLDNKDRSAFLIKRWSENNKDKRKATFKKYRANNIEKTKKACKEWSKKSI